MEWDKEKIQEILPFAEQTILNIKPSKQGLPDKRIWLKGKSGVYTTKSGYQAIIAERDLEPIQSDGPNTQWIGDIWALKTAPKLKIFLWKAANGALPVGERLLSRKITLNPTCKTCGELETVPHMLFLCEFAQQVWKLAPFAAQLDTSICQSFDTGWNAVKRLHCLPPTGITNDPLAPWIAWSLWKERNNRVFNSRSFTATETISKAITDAKEWMTAQTVTHQADSNFLKSNLRPRQSTVNCKTDGAWRSESKEAGMGWIYSLHANKQIISKHAKATRNVSSPLIAEAIAIREALEMAIDLRFRKMSLESDSLQLITAIVSRSMLTEAFGILSDIFSLCSSFEEISFHFIPRSKNNEADILAKAALCALVQNV